MKSSSVNWLYLATAVAFLLFVLLSLMFFNTIYQQLDDAAWARKRHDSINQITLLENLVVDMETGQRGFRATGEKRFLQPYEMALMRVEPALQSIQDLTADNPQQAARTTQVEAKIEELMSFWRYQNVETSNYTRIAITRITDQEKARLDLIRELLRELLQTEQNYLTRRQNASDASIHKLTYRYVIGTILLFLIALAVIGSYVRALKNRRVITAQLRETVEKLQEMNLASGEKNWLLTGMSTLNDALQDVNGITALTQEVLKTLTQFLQLPAGAFYHYHHEDRTLTMSASVALPADAPRSYALGEGLVGQAATEPQMTVINRVPDQYWAIGSGSGRAVPGALILIPLWHKKELKGLIELASFQAIDAQKLDLLRAITNNVAVAFDASEDHEKIVQLLEQLQEQKEILQAQQEELRQSNEELAHQTNVLQASEEELRVQEEELRQINTELERKNAVVEEARLALTQKARELEVTSKYKSEFLANMSHELRTPLNSVLILANLLADNKSQNLTQKQVEYANVIHKSGSDLLNLINDILDLSKIEAGKVELHMAPTLVSTMVNDLSQLFEVVAQEKGVQLATQVDTSVPATFLTDKQRLEQILKNLLSNAFKFTPKGGTVTLAFRTHPAIPGSDLAGAEKPALAISVTDTGIGIPPSKQQLIFEAFQQADGSTSRRYGGTGLGLSITKELTRRFGGVVQLQSEEGKGSTFTIVLPLSEMPENLVASPESPPVARPVAKSVSLPEIPTVVTPQKQLPDDRYAIKPGDKVMLIIEDDPIFAGVVRDFARSKQYKTIVALRGDEGIQYARTYKPSAIILDIQLPVVDGESILNWLQSDEQLKSIPVHVMSGADDTSFTAPGALAYMQKPVGKGDLENAFATINARLKERIKKVLVVSGSYLRDNSLRQSTDLRHMDLDFSYVNTEAEALQTLKRQPYDCLIVDMGSEVEKGIEELKTMRSALPSDETPVIIFLDQDLNPNDERQLRKLSDVVIRESSQALDRLMDELELFLYKVQEVEKKEFPDPAPKLNDRCLEGRKVLLVDDDMRNVFALSTLLEEQQMEVVTAGDGREALELLRQHPDTDIVLMDIMMPEMDGYEATRHIRKELKLTKLPVIALTAKAMPGDREKTIEAGASDYITKPIDSGRLFSLMRVWLSK